MVDAGDNKQGANAEHTKPSGHHQLAPRQGQGLPRATHIDRPLKLGDICSAKLLRLVLFIP